MKNTKKTRRVAAFAAAVMMAACVAVPMSSFSASAVDPTYSITINNSVAGYKYAAYKIFSGDLSGSTLSNVQWADDNKAGAALAAAKAIDIGTAETPNKPFKDCADAADVAKVLGDADALIKSDLAAAFADAMADIFTTSAATDIDGSDGYVLTVNEPGYYLVKNTAIPDASTTTGTSYTKFILKVLGEEEATPKTDAPTLEKKIWHNDTIDPTIKNTAPEGAGWGDVGDNQIGDTVYYYTKTSVPDMTYYDTYKYIIRDTMDSGLTMGEVTNIVYVPANTGKPPIDLKNAPTITKADDPSTTDFTETFYVSFADLKETLGTNADGGYIYTYYTATLNENAKVSNSANDTQHNDNTAYLTYSNNPNVSGSGDTNNTGDTPKDTVYDWTLTFNGAKVDENGNPLAGAGFTLYEGDSTTAINLVQIKNIADLHVNGITALADDTNYYRVAKAGETGTVTEMLQEGAKTKFMIIGLDDAQKYTLKETKTPATYNTGANVVINKLNTTYNTDGNKMTALTADIDNQGNVNTGVANSVTIQNNKGSVLPGTGGIGTTLFYVGGGVLVAGAGVLLITKKRAKKDAE